MDMHTKALLVIYGSATVLALVLAFVVAVGVSTHRERKRRAAALRRRHMRAASAARRQAWRDTHDVAVKASEPLRVEATRLDTWA